MKKRRWLCFAVLSCAGWCAVGCWPGGTYCQAGPKHGTECYAQADVEATQRTQGRVPPPEDLSRSMGPLVASPSASSVRVSSSTSTRGSNASPSAVTVQFVHAEPREGQAVNVDVAARKRAAEKYAVEIAEWLGERWVTSAMGAANTDPLPCSEARLLEAEVKMRVGEQGKVEGWDWVARSGNGGFDVAVEKALAELGGVAIPAPPALFADLRPRLLEVTLSNRTFPCSKASAAR